MSPRVCCAKWQGWGDGRVRTSDALVAAAKMRQKGVKGLDAFVRACEAVGDRRHALVPATAIDRLAMANVDILALDDKTRAILSWVGLTLAPGAGADAIMPPILKDAYSEYSRRLGRWNRYAPPVIPTLRAVLSGMLRAGGDADALDASAAADRVTDELGCTLVGTMTTPRVRSAFRLFALGLTMATIARAALLVLQFMYSIFYTMATMALRATVGFDVTRIPLALAGLCCAQYAAYIAKVHLRGPRFAKIASVADHAFPVLLLLRIIA